MNNFSKYLALFIFALVVCLSTNIHAQSSRKFSMGLNVGDGTGEDGNSLAIGFDMRYQIGANKQLSFPVTIGFTSIMNKDRVAINGARYKRNSFRYVPIKAGIKYYFDKTGVGFYGLGEIGAFMKRYIPNAQIFLIYSPAVGYAMKNGLDVAVKYEGFSDGNRADGYAGLRLAYGF